MTPFEQKVKAYYRGPESKMFKQFEEEYELKVISFGANPQINVIAFEGKTTIEYPSKKKFLEHWDPFEGWNTGAVVKMTPQKGKKVRETLTFAEAGGVIYTQIIEAFNRFNAKSALTYADDTTGKKPSFLIRLRQEEYNEETQEATGLYGAGVLEIEVAQFGLKRIVWQDGVSFHTKKELDNVGAYAPKLYMSALEGLIESACLYVLALNPDDPENVKAVEDAKNEQIPTIKGNS